MFNPYSMAREKLDDRVTFPLVLDLNPFVEKQPRPDGAAAVAAPAAADVASAPVDSPAALESSPSTEASKAVAQSSNADVAVAVAADAEAPAVVASEDAVAEVIDLEAAAADPVAAAQDDPMTPRDQIISAGAGEAIATEVLSAVRAEATKLPPPPPPTPVEAAAELVKKNGPHVYELYSVLVHSGSANGGHYYAYIMVGGPRAWISDVEVIQPPLTCSSSAGPRQPQVVQLQRRVCYPNHRRRGARGCGRPDYVVLQVRMMGGCLPSTPSQAFIVAAIIPT